MIFSVLLLHLVVGTTIVALGDRLGRRAFAVAALAPVATLVWLSTRLGDVLDGEAVVEEIGWVPQIGLTLGFRLDALGATMTLLVSGIGVLVCVYALGYFSHPKPGVARLAGLLTVPGLLPTAGPVGMRSRALMTVALRVMGNLITDADRDVVARAWRAAGRLSLRLDERQPFVS